MNIIYLGHSICKLLSQTICCNDEEEVRNDIITECIWCVCRIIVAMAKINAEDIQGIRTYLFYHTIYEITNNKLYNVLSLLFDLCYALSITEEQGITALHCAYADAVTDKAEVLADNVYRLYITNKE